MTLTMKPGDIVRRVVAGKPGKALVVLEVGTQEDNKGRVRPAVRCAKQEDLDLEASGALDPVWGAPVRFKAPRYWYLEGEVNQ